jgi:CheY-like chemotaxis protein
MPPEHDLIGEAVRGEIPTVLVVEDEWIIRAAIADYLRNCGYRVIEAGNAEEAVTALKTDARIKVVFADVQMPGSVDGFGLAQWVHRERTGVKIILTSGVKRAAAVAADLCKDGPLMEKPYSSAEVERRIRMLLADR